MEYIVGVSLALGISGLATVVGLDRDRAFYPTLTIVIASYYGLFAVIGGSLHALMVESAGVAAFLLLSLIGFRFSFWWVVAALAAHGIDARLAGPQLVLVSGILVAPGLGSSVSILIIGVLPRCRAHVAKSPKESVP